MKKLLLAFLLLAGPVAAQQSGIPTGSIPISRGAGVSGWAALAPGSNGNCPVALGGAWVSLPCPGGVGAGVTSFGGLTGAITCGSGLTCAAGTVSASGGGGGGITVGTTTVSGGTSGRPLYDNAGVVGEYLITGSGLVVMQTAPTITSPSLTSPTITSSFTATGLVKNADLVNTSTTVNGQTCTLGSTCTISTGTGLVVGTSPITGGTTGRVLFDLGGTLSEYPVTGSAGSVVLTGSPSILSPTILSHPTIEGVTSTGATGTGAMVFGTAPTVSALTVTGSVTATGLVTNAALATSGAATLKGNPTNATAAVTDFTIQGLTARGAPDATNDKIPLFDNAAGTIKYVTPGQVAAAATSGVSSLGGNTGAITCTTGIDCSTNPIKLASIASARIMANVTGGSAAPVANTGTSVFDSVYCNTVGYVVARLASAWTCSNDFPINMAWMGADGTGVTSVSTLANTAAATGKNLYFPKPTTCYNITADIVLTVAGQEVFGDGRGVPTFCVKTPGGFTNGVFSCNGLQPGPTFRDFAVTFTQPTITPSASTTGTISGTTLSVASGAGIAIGQLVGPVGNGVQPNLSITGGSGTTWTVNFAPTSYSGSVITYSVNAMRAQLQIYKPLVYCQDSARASVRHVLVNGAWDGFDFRGNTGGAELFDIQIGAYNRAIQFDGALDTTRLTDIHCWPYGISVANGDSFYQTPPGGPTSGAICLTAGRADGMTITNLTTLEQLGIYMFHGTAFTAGDPSVTCNACDFDTLNGGVQDAGTFNMTGGGIGIQTGVTGWLLEGSNSAAKFSNITTTSQTFGSVFLTQACTLCLMSVDQLNHTGSVNTVNFFGVAASATNSNFSFTNSYINQGSSQLSMVAAFAPTTGVNNFHIVNNIIQTAPNVAFTFPVINILGTCGTNVNRAYIAGNRVIDKGTGAGVFISKACAQFDVITNNIGPGWTYSLPAGTGIYTGNL